MRNALEPQSAVRLPTPISRLFGRASEIASLVELLVDSPHRLVTITGLGGCGKTRLAIEVAREVQATYAQGVAFFDLSAVTDPTLLGDELCRQLGMASPIGGTPLSRLQTVFADREQLSSWTTSSRSMLPVRCCPLWRKPVPV